jgi:type VI secretion system protein ImpI
MAGPTPLVVRVDDVETQKRAKYAFLKSPVRIGRSEISDLHLDRPYVSTCHGVVQFDDQRVTFVDLGSTNGTILAGARLEKNVPVELGPGDELRIGGLRLRIERGTSVDLAAAPRRATQFMRAVAARADSRRSIAPVAPGAVPAVAPPPAGPVPLVAPAAPGLQAPAAPPPPPEGSGLPAPGGGTPPAAIPPPLDPSDDRALRAIEDAGWQLQVLHDTWADARRVFDEAAEAVAQRVPEAERARCRALLAERYAAARSPAAAAPAAGLAAAAPASPVEPAADAVGMLREFAGAYLPAGAALEDAAQAQVFLESVADLLETSARSYIELRRGYEEFGKEMGLRVAQGEGPVARARDTRQLLAWLLARSDEPRAQELSSAFADLMIHQVALLNAVTEGGKALVARLSPEEITAALEREGAGRIALGVKTLREGAQWRAYVERYRTLTEDEGALTDALFGKEFARAYSAVVGRRDPAREGDGQDEDDHPRPGPGRPPR